jgi:hypothetical protein
MIQERKTADFEDGNNRLGRYGTRHHRLCPSDTHLYFEKCAWGISVTTWVIWAVSAVLLLSYCMSRSEILLGVVHVANLVAIMTTIIFVRRSDTICPYHREIARTTKSDSPANLSLGFNQKEHLSER